MTIEEYTSAAEKFGYAEEKIFLEHPEEFLKDFIEYEETDLDLKIYLCELLIYRHFMAVGGIILPDDVNWFIDEYFSTFDADYVDLMRTTPIIEAKNMIMLDDMFGKTTIGTIFMFAIIEFILNIN